MKSGKQSQTWVKFCIKFCPKMARRKRSAPVKLQAKYRVEEPSEIQQEVEYVTETLDSSQCEEFLSIFSRFQPQEPSDQSEITPLSPPLQTELVEEKEEKDEDNVSTEPLSRKKSKRLSRIPLAELKNLAPKPEVVEYEDTTAPEPLFLVHLKALPNTIPVPGHWSQKRKYLAGKRGFLKAPYELPEYIKATGIMEQRNTLKQREESMSLSAKAREKINPRLGKISLDYEVMYNAFFKYQTKPDLTGYGDVYFEGKEFESRLRDKKPGIVSEELANALGMAPLAPPPWLYNMQRFGPPPSYPFLKIPGLSAPLPEGCQWGFHPGGWGKPPVDEHNRPLYGDVFGLGIYNVNSFNEQIDESEKMHWGVVLPEEEIVIEPPPPPPTEELPLVDGISEPQEDQPVVVQKESLAATLNRIPKQKTDNLIEQRELFQIIPESVKHNPIALQENTNSIALSNKSYQVPPAKSIEKEKKKEFKF